MPNSVVGAGEGGGLQVLPGRVPGAEQWSSGAEWRDTENESSDAVCACD